MQLLRAPKAGRCTAPAQGIWLVAGDVSKSLLRPQPVPSSGKRPAGRADLTELLFN